ncbi:MAG: hypothetical protein GXO58_03015 [Thermodesulfobacteria bacterium]|nr:hypothetical protein [Thermodesulfobacteriota bacterium]
MLAKKPFTIFILQGACYTNSDVTRGRVAKNHGKNINLCLFPADNKIEAQ